MDDTTKMPHVPLYLVVEIGGSQTLTKTLLFCPFLKITVV